MRSQINMIWNKMPHHHTIFSKKKIDFFFFFMIMESRILFFSWHVMTKLHAMILIFNFVKKHFDIIHDDVHVCRLHLYEINTHTHSSRFELMTSWSHTKVLTTKPLQDFIGFVLLRHCGDTFSTSTWVEELKVVEWIRL
jgi:hypothetical protein